MRAGLRLPEDLDRENDLKLTELRASIQKGMQSNEEKNADDVLNRLEEKYRSTQS